MEIIRSKFPRLSFLFKTLLPTLAQCPMSVIFGTHQFSIQPNYWPHNGTFSKYFYLTNFVEALINVIGLIK